MASPTSPPALGNPWVFLSKVGIIDRLPHLPSTYVVLGIQMLVFTLAWQMTEPSPQSLASLSINFSLNNIYES